MAPKYRHMIIVLTLMFLVFTTATQAQSKGYVICDGAQAWLVNGAIAASVGKCTSGTWAISINIDSKSNGKSQKTTRREREALAILQHISTDNLKAIQLDQTSLKGLLKKNQKGVELVIEGKLLPKPVREFFEGGGSESPSMEFIITRGILFVQPFRYEEITRFTIKVHGSNPTIKEILEEAKKHITDAYWQEDLPYAYLMLLETQQDLDESKTSADYNLRNGAVLRIGSRRR